MTSSPIKGMLLDLEGVPTLPVFVQRLLEAIHDECSTAQDLEQIIRQDPAMSARLLRVANSSFFGLQGQVRSLDRAIVLLGTRYVQALAISISIVDTEAYRNANAQLPLECYWIHSFACGWTCQRLVTEGVFAGNEGEEAFMAGLLHDIGKLLLWIYLKKRYQEVSRRIRQEGCATHEAESAVLGQHHGEVGGDLAHWWKLPEEIQQAVRWHHDPLPKTRPARLVKLADEVANSAGFSDGLQPKGDGALFSLADAHSDHSQILDRLVFELQERPAEILEIVNLLHQESR